MLHMNKATSAWTFTWSNYFVNQESVKLCTKFCVAFNLLLMSYLWVSLSRGWSGLYLDGTEEILCRWIQIQN